MVPSLALDIFHGQSKQVLHMIAPIYIKNKTRFRLLKCQALDLTKRKKGIHIFPDFEEFKFKKFLEIEPTFWLSLEIFQDTALGKLAWIYSKILAILWHRETTIASLTWFSSFKVVTLL